MVPKNVLRYSSMSASLHVRTLELHIAPERPVVIYADRRPACSNWEDFR